MQNETSDTYRKDVLISLDDDEVNEPNELDMEPREVLASQLLLPLLCCNFTRFFAHADRLSKPPVEGMGEEAGPCWHWRRNASTCLTSARAYSASAWLLDRWLPISTGIVALVLLISGFTLSKVPDLERSEHVEVEINSALRTCLFFALLFSLFASAVVIYAFRPHGIGRESNEVQASDSERKE